MVGTSPGIPAMPSTLNAVVSGPDLGSSTEVSHLKSHGPRNHLGYKLYIINDQQNWFKICIYNIFKIFQISINII